MKKTTIHPTLLIGLAMLAVTSGLRFLQNSNIANIIAIILSCFGIFLTVFGIVKTVKMRQKVE